MEWKAGVLKEVGGQLILFHDDSSLRAMWRFLAAVED
jgi:hypothetical protein